MLSFKVLQWFQTIYQAKTFQVTAKKLLHVHAT